MRVSHSCLSKSVDREDVTVMFGQSMLLMAAWQMSQLVRVGQQGRRPIKRGRMSWSCLSKVCCLWLHTRSKPLFHVFILDRSLPFHIGSIRRCMTVHQNRVYTRLDKNAPKCTIGIKKKIIIFVNFGVSLTNLKCIYTRGFHIPINNVSLSSPTDVKSHKK